MSSITQLNKFFVALVALLVVTMNEPAEAEDLRPYMTLETKVLALGGSCEPEFLNLLAGSSFGISLRNSEDQPRTRLRNGWPEGYSLEATLDLTANQTFKPVPGLAEQLRPVTYHDRGNVENDSALAENADWMRLQALNRKHFMLHIPRDLIGHTLAIRAHYVRNGVDLYSNACQTLKIIALCNVDDSARVMASLIYEAWDELNYERAIELSDSMLSIGWSDAGAWDIAMSSADRLGLYERELVYLERMFTDFRCTDVRFGATYKPQKCGETQPTAEWRQRYEERNRWLQEKITETRQEEQRR
jgi:hypothetical protein